MLVLSSPQIKTSTSMPVLEKQKTGNVNVCANNGNINQLAFSSAYSNCHKNLFLAKLNMNKKVNFKGIPHTETVKALKGSLTSICKETINAYNNGDHRIKWCDFTRCFIHKCYNFSQDEGDDLYKYLYDPLGPNKWGGYLVSKKRISPNGHALETNTKNMMEQNITPWVDRFVKIIETEEHDKKNTLLTSLLKEPDNIVKIKSHLGIQI